jgi:hypothetical protein
MSERELLAAARHVLHAWDAELQAEKSHSSNDLWEAMEELRRAVTVIHEVVPSE